MGMLFCLVTHIEESIQGKVPQRSIRWYAIKIFERDREVIADLDIGVGLMKHLEEHIRDCEKELEDDAESIITNQRYWPGRAPPSASQLLAFSPGQEQAAGVRET